MPRAGPLPTAHRQPCSCSRAPADGLAIAAIRSGACRGRRRAAAAWRLCVDVSRLGFDHPRFCQAGLQPTPAPLCTPAAGAPGAGYGGVSPRLQPALQPCPSCWRRRRRQRRRPAGGLRAVCQNRVLPARRQVCVQAAAEAPPCCEACQAGSPDEHVPKSMTKSIALPCPKPYHPASPLPPSHPPTAPHPAPPAAASLRTRWSPSHKSRVRSPASGAAAAACLAAAHRCALLLRRPHPPTAAVAAAGAAAAMEARRSTAARRAAAAAAAAPGPTPASMPQPVAAAPAVVMAAPAQAATAATPAQAATAAATAVTTVARGFARFTSDLAFASTAAGAHLAFCSAADRWPGLFALSPIAGTP